MSTYEPASWETRAGGCQPGAKALLDSILAGNPWASSLGCYADRPVRGSSSPSLHREGRAIDVGVNPNNPADVARMHALVDQLTAKGQGIQQIIWHGRSWRPGQGWRPYSGASPHNDHAHIELSWAAARGEIPPISGIGIIDTLTGGALSGAAGNALGALGIDIDLQKLVLTGLAVAGGVALVVLGALRSTNTPGGNP